MWEAQGQRGNCLGSRRVFAGANMSKVSAFGRTGSRGGPGWLWSTALTRWLLGNPVPPTAEGNGPGTSDICPPRLLQDRVGS